MRHPFRTAATAVALASLAGCVQVYPQESAKPSPAAQTAAAKPAGDKPDKGPFKPWDEALKDTRAIDGFFKAHLKRDQSLLLELRPDQLDRDFGMVLHLSRGVGDFFMLYDGMSISDMRLMRFRRVGDKVHLVHRNARFQADPGSPMAASLEDNVGHSILEAFKIESENAETKAVLVDVSGFFASDYAQLSELLKFAYGNKPVRFEKEKSHVERVMGFPDNLEVDAAISFGSSDYPTFTPGYGVSDVRSIPVGVRYSLVRLPEDPMMPRLADDRVGHFLDAVWDYSRDRDQTGFLRYVNRWRLEKKDPAAEKSEPVKPIVYYVDRSVPEPYRKYVREGIEGWNKAFEAAGFQNAIVAMDPPADSAWSAEDARYSTVRWTTGYNMGFAIGPSQTDPRTGEILNADVLIASNWTRFWQDDWDVEASPSAMIQKLQEMERVRASLPPHLAERLCFAAFGKLHELRMQYAALLAADLVEPGSPMPEEFLGQAIRELVLHEVGHTIGLRHNFKASSGVDNARLHDKRWTLENGVVLSVMDYNPANIARDPKQQGWYWNPEVGSYDVWAVKYAYAPVYEQSPTSPFAYSGQLAATPDAERVGLAKVAREASSPLHTYGTDEDLVGGPYGVDPLVNTYDLGADPLAYARDRMDLVARIQPRLERRLIADGDGYQRLRGAMNTLLFDRYRNAVPAAKYIGGLYTARDHKGDPNGRAPFTPVPAAEQRAAVQFLVDHIFAENAFEFDPALLNKLAPNRWAHWGSPSFTLQVDYPIHDEVGWVQSALLRQVLDRFRLRRMIDNEVRMPRGAEAYTVADLFGTLSGAIWSELGGGARAPRDVSSFRRNLQRAYIQELSDLLMDTRTPFQNRAVPEDARSLARWELTQTSRRLGEALEAGRSLDTPTRAHLAESKARIDRVLEASLSLDRPR